jgi:hypothetical protein
MTNAIKALLQMTSVSLQPVPSLINSLSSFYYKFFEKITMQFLPLLITNLNNLLNLNFPLFQMLLKIPAQI